MRPLPWLKLLLWAVAGTAVAATPLLTAAGDRTGPQIIGAGRDGSAAAVVAADFPDDELLDGLGHDGQQFYAVARDPWPIDAAAPALDRPAYRLQRPVFPWVAHALARAPGEPLVAALVAVGVAALLLGAVATGALSATLGGPVWAAALFPLLPGTAVALRLTTADGLALALAVAALALSLRGRGTAAVGVAVLAVLTREPTWLLLAGLALWRRDRDGWLLAGVPAAVAGVWWITLRVTVPAAPSGTYREFGPPLVGLWESLTRFWLDGRETLAATSVLIAVLLAGWALARHGLRAPLGWATLLSLLALVPLSIDVIGLSGNATRTVAPLTLLAALTLLTGGRGPGAVDPPASEPDAVSPPPASPASTP